MSDTPSITQELTFLIRQTGEDELTLLSRALHVGLKTLYGHAVEQAFINDEITQDKAVAALGRERVKEIQYAKQALAQDIARGLGL